MDIKGLVERVEMAVLVKKNIFLTYEEFKTLLIHLLPKNAVSNTADRKFDTFYGRPLVRSSGGFKLFMQCQYCGTEEFPSHLGWCLKCGRYV